MPKITSQRKHSLGFQPYGNKTSHGLEIVSETVPANASSAATSSSSAAHPSNNKSKGNQAVIKSIIETVKNQEKIDDNEAGNTLSRGQRKRLQRKEKVMIKIGLLQPNLKTAATHTADKTGDKSKKTTKAASTTDIPASSFAFTLQEMTTNNEEYQQHDNHHALPNTIITSNKLKKEVAIRESNRIKAVQAHPVFQENPIAAIHQHLQQLLAQQPPPASSNNHNNNNKKKGNSNKK